MSAYFSRNVLDSHTVRGITVASATCKGSYEQMDEVMAAVAQWVRDNNYQFDGPAFNIYHVSPYETSDAREFITEYTSPFGKNEPAK